MANGDPMTNFDPETRIAALGERVEGQGRRLSSLEATVTQGFKQVEVSIGSLSSEFRNSQRPQWQAIGVALTFATVVGALAYWPIRENQSDFKSDLRSIADSAMSVSSFVDFKATYENNRIVSRTEYIDKFNAVNSSIAKIADDQVPRKEMDRVWASQDRQFSDLQRQLDEIKASVANVYSPRDVIRDTLERIDRLERERAPPPIIR